MVAMATIREITSLIDDYTSKDEELISRAYIFAETAHKSHTRFSGEPYLNHLTETAKILAEYGMSANTVAAGLLHDTIEDTDIALEVLKHEFGKEIFFLIEGVTKLGKLKYRGADRHNESLRKLFVAMSQDIRVLIIKLADRLNNMRTLSFVPKDKQERIASETLEIYAPIAYRLGIRKLSRELEDLAFPYVYPKEYEKAKLIAKEKYEEHVENLEKFLKSVKKALAKDGMSDVRTEYRVKGLYSLYKKIEAEENNVDNVYDILALRIIVPTINDCYRALGVVHGTWRPVPNRIKDYIAFPKPNGYQSIHTTVFTGDGSFVEVQIRTSEMHKHAEYGIASHISYKEGSRKGKTSEGLDWINELLPKRNFKEVVDWESVPDLTAKFKDIPHWIKDLAEHQENVKDNEKFREDLRSDFFQFRIFVFTPEGDVVDLPKGSTPVDFAYSIHSDIGNHMSGAKVNGKLVSLDTALHGGDIVEIITRPSAKPSGKWLEHAQTTMARRHIRSSIQKESKKTK
jgi:GTP pyrophosphokinase